MRVIISYNMINNGGRVFGNTSWDGNDRKETAASQMMFKIK